MAMMIAVLQSVDDPERISTHGSWRNWSELSRPAIIRIYSCARRWPCDWIWRNRELRWVQFK